MNRLEEDYGDQVKFVHLNADTTGKEAFEAGRFPGHPAFILMLADGQEFWRSFGIVSYDVMESELLSSIEQ